MCINKKENIMKKVVIEFYYKDEKGKTDDYYKQKAFDEIYNADDILNSDDWKVIKTPNLF
jgi:hypothetical protein